MPGSLFASRSLTPEAIPALKSLKFRDSILKFIKRQPSQLEHVGV